MTPPVINYLSSPSVLSLLLNGTPCVGVSRVVYDVAFYLGCWMACRRIHNLLLERVMRLPSHFFDTTPMGRILQRFSKDVEVVDSKLPELLTDWVICSVEVIRALNSIRLGQ